MIECIKFKSHESGCLRGFADIFVSDPWGVEIKGIALFMKDGRRWVTMPGNEYTDKEGQTKRAPFLWFRDKERNERFCDGVKKAIDKWCAENPQQPEPVSSGFTSPEPEVDDFPF